MSAQGPDREELGCEAEYQAVVKKSRFSLSTFHSLRYPGFRDYYGALLSQTGARSILAVSRALLIYRLTGSVTILASMALITAIPGILLSLYGGVLADRLPKRYILMVGQGGSIFASLIVAVSISAGWIGETNEYSWIIIIAAALVQSTILSMVVPSRHAIVPELVGEKHILNAVSLNNMGRNVLRLSAPVLAGLVIDHWDFEPIFYITAGLYVIALFFTWRLPVKAQAPAPKRDAIADVKEALRYIRREANLMLILAITAAATFFTMSFHQLLPVITEDVLKVDATSMGLLTGVSAGGAIIGALVLASLPNRRRGLMLVGGGLIMALALIVFAFSENWYLSLAIILIVGMAMAVRTTMSNTLIQYYTDESYRGRVMSVYMMEIGLISLGVFVAGVLADFIGIQWAIGGMAMVFAVICVLILLFSRRTRELQ